MTPGYEYFEVEADVGVVGCGADAAEAFVQTGLGVFALIVDPASVREQERREVRAHGEGLGDLLVNWINECLYVHDVEGFVARRIELVAFETSPRGGGEPLRLHAFLHGEEVDPGRHRLGTVVKAATLHQVAVAPIEGGWQARLIVDV
jgi:SHS2 domain-containing protein